MQLDRAGTRMRTDQTFAIGSRWYQDAIALVLIRPLQLDRAGTRMRSRWYLIRPLQLDRAGTRMRSRWYLIRPLQLDRAGTRMRTDQAFAIGSRWYQDAN